MCIKVYVCVVDGRSQSLVSVQLFVVQARLTHQWPVSALTVVLTWR